jgi:chromosomal replication initiation ATPase DnaA
MGNYIRERKLYREIAAKLQQEFKMEVPYFELKETVADIVKDCMMENSAFIYFQPEFYSQFTLRPGIEITISEINVGKNESLKDFEHLVEFFFKYKWPTIISGVRSQELVTARQFVSTWLKQNTNWSLKRIGRFMGDQDHSTVIHSVRSVEDRISVEKPYYNFWLNFNEYLNVYIESNTAGGLGETSEGSGGTVAENREASSGKKTDNKRLSKV